MPSRCHFRRSRALAGTHAGVHFVAHFVAEFIGTFGLALLLFAAALGQTPAPAKSAPAAGTARVEQIVVRDGDRENSHRDVRENVHESGGALTIEIKTSGPGVSPDTQALADPDRIVIDFPGAVPAASLHALQVNRGALKRIRAGLFFSNPPITRIVLDLAEPQPYHISLNGNSVAITLSPAGQNPVKLASAAVKVQTAEAAPAHAPASPARLQNALLATGEMVGESEESEEGKDSENEHAQAGQRRVTGHAIANGGDVDGGGGNRKPALAKVSSMSLPTTSLAMLSQPALRQPTSPQPTLPQPTLPQMTEAVSAAQPAKPVVSVTFANGLLSIRADKATLAQVLFEVQRLTLADIPIPAGAELEEVAADIGPAPAREVLASLLNGSHYNFIFVGNEANLERVILTRREANP